MTASAAVSLRRDEPSYQCTTGNGTERDERQLAVFSLAALMHRESGNDSLGILLTHREIAEVVIKNLTSR